MLVPLCWLNDYVKTKLSPKQLAERLTEIGLALEEIKKDEGETVLNLETTANRPDWLSIMGIAWEVAAISNTSATPLAIKELAKPKKTLPMTVVTDFKLAPRHTSVIIDGIQVKPSPEWLQKRLRLVGLRPINNIVDITNYVMLELGNPMHAFDYDQISPKKISIELTRGQEDFTSVDGISYKLPRGTIIIKNGSRIIDLCGIKGGLNSGISSKTKTVFLHTIAHYPTPIRRASQALALKSDASLIFERGVNFGGTLVALKRAANLITELAGGQIASKVEDIKEKEFGSWKLKMEVARANKILGINIPTKEMIKTLKGLNLSPQLGTKGIIEVTVPTYRNDLKIEEDLIEEVGRIHGYNQFPLTMIEGETPSQNVAYRQDYQIEAVAKNCLRGAGFAEIYSYSLISEQDLKGISFNPNQALKITNPISQEFEYLRPTLLINSLKAVVLNQERFGQLRLFELGRAYQGSLLRTKEPLMLAGVSSTDDFYDLKGVVEALLEGLGIVDYKIFPPTEQNQVFSPGKTAIVYIKGINVGVIGEISPSILRQMSIKAKIFAFEIDFDSLSSWANSGKKYLPVSKYPAVVEDLTLEVPKKIAYQQIKDIIAGFKEISQFDLISRFENRLTFRLYYQLPGRQATTKDAQEIRQQLLGKLKVLGLQLAQPKELG